MSLWNYCEGVLAHWSLQTFPVEPVWGLSSMNCFSWSFQSIWISFKVELWQGHFKTSKTLMLVFFAPFRGGLVGLSWVTVLLNNPSALKLQGMNWAGFSCRANFMVPSMTARWSGPETAKQPSIITPPHLTFNCVTHSFVENGFHHGSMKSQRLYFNQSINQHAVFCFMGSFSYFILSDFVISWFIRSECSFSKTYFLHTGFR